MKGSHKNDPVELLGLSGQLVGVVTCPHMIAATKRLWAMRFHGKDRACGQQATLVRFPPPYGFRTYCEEGHVEVVSHLSHPMPKPRKGATD